MENITFLKDYDQIDKDKFHFAIKLSNIEKVFDINKIKTFTVGINGSKVTGGQAQKILFARSIFHFSQFIDHSARSTFGKKVSPLKDEFK